MSSPSIKISNGGGKKWDEQEYDCCHGDDSTEAQDASHVTDDKEPPPKTLAT